MYMYELLCVAATIGLASAFIFNQPRCSQHRAITFPLRSVPSQEDVFYPTPKASLEGLSEDDVLHDLFLRQILMDNSGGTSSTGTDEPNQHSRQEYANAPQINKKVVEMPVEVEENMPLEFVYKGRVTVGNFVSRKVGKSGTLSLSSLIVRLVTGEEVTIDAGQIISCWDMLADESLPVEPLDWAQITSEALEILGNMSPRKSDLQEFWQLVSKQRSTAISVDSLDLGVYIFQERSFRKWINPYADATEANVRALSAAQRYAAALLLYNDDFHFKRKPSCVGVAAVDDDDVSGSGSGYSVDDVMKEDDEDNVSTSSSPYPLLIVDGAYKVLDEGSSMFREGSSRPHCPHCQFYMYSYYSHMHVPSLTRRGLFAVLSIACLVSCGYFRAVSRGLYHPPVTCFRDVRYESGRHVSARGSQASAEAAGATIVSGWCKHAATRDEPRGDAVQCRCCGCSCREVEEE